MSSTSWMKEQAYKLLWRSIMKITLLSTHNIEFNAYEQQGSPPQDQLKRFVNLVSPSDHFCCSVTVTWIMSQWMIQRYTN